MQDHISRSDGEYTKLMKVLNFRLPHRFKKIGLFGALGLFIFLLGYKFWGSNLLILKDVMRSSILFFMLIATLSKDQLEDEFNKHVRFQSYVLAFVCAAIYCISIPLIAVILDFAITNITGDGQVSFYEISAFEVLFTMMGMQILFFHALKRFGSCATD